MKEAIEETTRRKKIQEEYNEQNDITPQTIIKEIREVITNTDDKGNKKEKKKMTKKELELAIYNIEEEMKEAARNLDFERAMELRDILFEMKTK